MALEFLRICDFGFAIPAPKHFCYPKFRFFPLKGSRLFFGASESRAVRLSASAPEQWPRKCASWNETELGQLRTFPIVHFCGRFS